MTHTDHDLEPFPYADGVGGPQLKTRRPRIRALLRSHAEQILDMLEERHPIVLFDREEHAECIVELLRNPISLTAACFGITERVVAESITDDALALYADAWATFLLVNGEETLGEEMLGEMNPQTR